MWLQNEGVCRDKDVSTNLGAAGAGAWRAESLDAVGTEGEGKC